MLLRMLNIDMCAPTVSNHRFFSHLSTGGNTGLGKETCIRLAKLGASVIIGSRSQERGEKAAADVRSAANSDKVTKALFFVAFSTYSKSPLSTI